LIYFAKSNKSGSNYALTLAIILYVGQLITGKKPISLDF
jgi:hypothetical protein